MAPADDVPNAVTRIEEDWVLEIVEPSYDETAPQITNTISPYTHLDCKFGLFELNHGTQPEYRDGGMTLQIWDHGEPVNSRRHENTNRLSYSGETINYTVAMSIETAEDNSRTLQFAVKNGTSQTWGTFGDQENLKCSIPTSRQYLSNYSPSFSVDNSKIGFASFRVGKYALVQVRYYNASGELVSTDTTERIAHVYSDNVSITE